MTPIETPVIAPTLFDTREPFTVVIRSGGRRECKVRYPSDKQWIERSAKFLLKQTDIGRDKSVNELAPIEKFDSQLFDNILLEAPAEFDEYERSTVIDRLALADVVASAQEGEDLVSVTLAVFGTNEDGEQRKVTIWLREPRRKEIVEYQRVAMKMVHMRKGREVRVAVEPSMRLFEKHFVRAEGYAEGSPIPAVHQDAAVVEMNRLLGEA